MLDCLNGELLFQVRMKTFIKSQLVDPVYSSCGNQQSILIDLIIIII